MNMNMNTIIESHYQSEPEPEPNSELEYYMIYRNPRRLYHINFNNNFNNNFTTSACSSNTTLKCPLCRRISEQGIISNNNYIFCVICHNEDSNMKCILETCGHIFHVNCIKSYAISQDRFFLIN